MHAVTTSIAEPHRPKDHAEVPQDPLSGVSGLLGAICELPRTKNPGRHTEAGRARANTSPKMLGLFRPRKELT